VRQHMDISIVILNWNQAADTIRCIQRIGEWQGLLSDIWIVDNDSSGDDVATILESCPDVHMIRNDSNLGYSGGVNRALRAILQRSDSPILLLNNDAFIAETSLMRLLDTLLEDDKIGLAGPLIFSAKDANWLLSAGGRSPVLHYRSSIASVPTGKQVYQVAYLSGSIALLRSQMLREVGLLDEAYFFSMEVADLCRRARKSGFVTVVDPRATATHDLDRSLPFRNNLYVYYIIRNRFVYIRKAYFVRAIPLTFIWSVYSLLLALKLGISGKKETSRAVLIGLVDGLTRRSGGQNERVLAFCGLARNRGQ
jgi:GT2 family glycosyltransferase